MRLFVAIDLPDAVRTALAREQARLRASCPGNSAIRWTSPETLHLTLKFLGETAPDRVQDVVGALQSLHDLPQCEVEVKGFGFFPDARRPRVFWAGLEASPGLAALARRVDRALSELGFPQEDRAFTPHLTLARFRIPRAEPALVKSIEHSALSLGRFEVKEYFLYESWLRPAGAEHKKLARFSLL